MLRERERERERETREHMMNFVCLDHNGAIELIGEKIFNYPSLD